MSDITIAVGDGDLGSADVSHRTDPSPPDSVSPATDPLTAIGIQTLSQAVEMLREDVKHERDRADQAEHRVDELLHQLAEAPERGLGADPMTAIGTQTLSQTVEMLREDVEQERDRADQAERQVEIERQLVEEGRKRIDELQASLADERRRIDGLHTELADARTMAMISGSEAAVLRTQLTLLTDERRRPWWRRWFQ